MNYYTVEEVKAAIAGLEDVAFFEYVMNPGHLSYRAWRYHASNRIKAIRYLREKVREYEQ